MGMKYSSYDFVCIRCGEKLRGRTMRWAWEERKGRVYGLGFYHEHC